MYMCIYAHIYVYIHKRSCYEDGARSCLVPAALSNPHPGVWLQSPDWRNKLVPARAQRAALSTKKKVLQKKIRMPF